MHEISVKPLLFAVCLLILRGFPLNHLHCRLTTCLSRSPAGKHDKKKVGTFERGMDEER